MHGELEQDEDLDPEDDFYQEPDLRSQDAKAFHLPRSAQGPTYFRYSKVAANGEIHGLALFLDFGTTVYGVSRAFARLAILAPDRPAQLSLSVADLNQLAGNLFDEVDRRRKLDVTITTGVPAADLVPHRLPIDIPVEELTRLVGALLDAVDSLENYSRTRHLRPRNPDS